MTHWFPAKSFEGKKCQREDKSRQLFLGEKCSGRILSRVRVTISVVGGNNSRDKLLGDKMCIM